MKSSTLVRICNYVIPFLAGILVGKNLERFPKLWNLKNLKKENKEEVQGNNSSKVDFSDFQKISNPLSHNTPPETNTSEELPPVAPDSAESLQT